MNDGLRHRRPDVSNGGADAPGAAKVDSGGWGTLDLMRRVKGAAADALLDLRAMWAHVTVVLGLVRRRSAAALYLPLLKVVN